MDYNEVWENKHTKNIMKIIRPINSKVIEVTFDFGLNPKRTYEYEKAYIQEHYKYAGYKSIWHLGKGLMDLNPKFEQATVIEPLEINDEDILFSDHTGDEKVDEFQKIELNDGEKPLTKDT